MPITGRVTWCLAMVVPLNIKPPPPNIIDLPPAWLAYNQIPPRPLHGANYVLGTLAPIGRIL